MAVHLGEVDENAINNMSIPFFKDVLKALGKSLNYTAAVNLYGNAFAKDAGKYVEKANPLYKEVSYGANLASLIANPKNFTPTQQITDIDWAN